MGEVVQLPTAPQRPMRAGLKIGFQTGPGRVPETMDVEGPVRWFGDSIGLLVAKHPMAIGQEIKALVVWNPPLVLVAGVRTQQDAVYADALLCLEREIQGLREEVAALREARSS